MLPKRQKKSSPFLYASAKSDVNAFADDQVLTNFTVWSHLAPSVKQNPDLVFGKLLVLKGSTPVRFRVKQIDPPGFEDEEFELDASDCFNTNDDMADPQAITDIGLLAHQNPAAVLHFLERHWKTRTIYTVVEPLLVAINPFRDLGLCNDQIIQKYRFADNVDDLRPHVFLVARRALDNYVQLAQSQTIIVTGESGAGKTEATKMIMRFFACTQSGSSSSRVQDAVMAANPVLEAFGNAKTIRNNNSSRFGRFMKFDVGMKGIMSGAVEAFLLEKVRVVSQEVNERSYHIFYQLIKGANSEERKALKLLNDASDYISLRGGKTSDAPGIDDKAEWQSVKDSFNAIGLDSSTQMNIYKILSAVLLLGNVKLVVAAGDGSSVAADSLETLEQACELAGLNSDVVMQEMTTSKSKVGSELVVKRLKLRDAQVQQQSLCKALYEKLFHWVVSQLNRSISPPSGFSAFIGMLDIFGFEIFANNSLEQLMINITNELLQKNFTDIVFAREKALYSEEGISAKDLVFSTNDKVISTLIGRGSLLTQLEDACLAPGGTDSSFVSNCTRALVTTSDAIFRPTKQHADMRFLIAHSVADVEYNADGFLLKNRDLLKADLVEAVKAAKNPVTALLMENVKVERGKLAKGQLIASQFLRQLQDLMALITSTESHFIRCVKPNETKLPTDWNAGKVLNQLFCLSILEALQLKQLGFSYRRPFEDFCKQFKFIDTSDASVPRVEAARAILSRNGMKEGTDYQIGKTRVFMTSDSVKRLLHIQRLSLARWTDAVNLIEAHMLRYKLRLQLDEQIWRLHRIQAHAKQREIMIDEIFPKNPPQEDNIEIAKVVEGYYCETYWRASAYWPYGGMVRDEDIKEEEKRIPRPKDPPPPPKYKSPPYGAALPHPLRMRYYY